ncbi:MAG: hypothetical protein AWM53_00543 [Candidatus Dichloromethanomonas elyunquensis]|nr:MAG: hypothetical protein AWM53_00543 [Candidatus Dichloromethanomonas elyunquensis]
MTLTGKHSLESFIFYLSLAAGGVVLLFSVSNGYSFFMILIRTVLSFFLIYFLGNGLLTLWEKFSPPLPKKEVNFRSTIDVILSDLNARGMKGSTYNAGGSVVESEDKEQLPGQISKDMKNGLQDAGTKAEIVRRMGWGEEE